MNLAEQVRQVHELKKDYEEARHSLKQQNCAPIYCDLESEFKHYVTHAKSTEVYFLDMNDDYDGDTLTRCIEWFSQSNKSLSDAEKVAKEHGFTTELVELGAVLGFKLISPIKALKITWGE